MQISDISNALAMKMDTIVITAPATKGQVAFCRQP